VFFQGERVWTEKENVSPSSAPDTSPRAGTSRKPASCSTCTRPCMAHWACARAAVPSGKKAYPVPQERRACRSLLPLGTAEKAVLLGECGSSDSNWRANIGRSCSFTSSTISSSCTAIALGLGARMRGEARKPHRVLGRSLDEHPVARKAQRSEALVEALRDVLPIHGMSARMPTARRTLAFTAKKPLLKRCEWRSCRAA
jgi:hypothetical protein